MNRLHGVDCKGVTGSRMSWIGCRHEVVSSTSPSQKEDVETLTASSC